MISTISIRKDAYKDSVRLLEATRSMQSLEDIDYAWVVMATPANLESLAEEGFTEGLDRSSANDLVFAVRGASDAAVAEAIDIATTKLFEAQTGDDTAAETAPKSLQAALADHPEANVAIVSVPGPFAALETQKALTAGLDVLLFSDNVPLEDEIALKERARDLGLLVMGPGAGTAMIAGTGLGFANRVSKGPVGVIAAAGTGAQEVMSLLDRWGIGVSHVIGLGGRDLSPAVGGIMAESAIRALDADEATESILLVSKPPSPEVAERLLKLSTKPMVAALIGLQGDIPTPDHVRVCNTLEQGAALTLAQFGVAVPDLVGDLANEVAGAITGLPPTRTRLSGLFSGGTLCYEAMTIATEHIGPIYSNTPLDDAYALPAPDGAHVCLDLGEEEYTQGRPHPMIDPEARTALLLEQAADPSVAVVLIDVVIGDGSHPDPAGMLAPAAAQVVASGAIVIAYVLGTERDPQGFASQQETLRRAGCIVPETAARGALAAAAVVLRDPALVHASL